MDPTTIKKKNGNKKNSGVRSTSLKAPKPTDMKQEEPQTTQLKIEVPSPTSPEILAEDLTPIRADVSFLTVSAEKETTAGSEKQITRSNSASPDESLTWNHVPDKPQSPSNQIISDLILEKAIAVEFDVQQVEPGIDNTVILYHHYLMLINFQNYYAKKLLQSRKQSQQSCLQYHLFHRTHCSTR